MEVVMRSLARVLIDESHRQAWSTRPELAALMNPVHPADAGYVQLAASTRDAGFELVVHAEGLITEEALAGFDLLVIPHAADDEWEKTTGVGSPKLTDGEIDSIEGFVIAGGSLVILAETEQPKYGNNFALLTERFGISILNTTVQDPTNSYKNVPTWILADLLSSQDHDLTAQVDQVCFYRAGALTALASTKVEIVARSSADASPANVALMMTTQAGIGRVIVVADSDLFGDDSINDLDHRQLWLNIVTWAVGARTSAKEKQLQSRTWANDDAVWLSLVDAVEKLRPMQSKDGSIDTTVHEAAQGIELVTRILEAVHELTPRFGHQEAYFAQLEIDMQKWVSRGFDIPDYFDSLELFRPDQQRKDGVEHLAIFSMYTQNGNPNRNVEAVITRTFWPEWLAQQEKVFNNSAFVPIEFVAFTKGYDTHAAVFFPETVATRETAVFYWGGIFCDREAARLRLVSRAAANTLGLSLTPDADLLLNDQELAQETCALWDLIHDRTHSHGDLPFDPFMIKQRMPFWMYALEELRCDLNTFKETLELDRQGLFLGRYVRYAILFDRLFRFPISGARVRNYDGLGGQILFAWLHKNGVLRWTDNKLTLNWGEVSQSTIDLCDKVENLYRTGIDRSRFAQWLASYNFVAELVEPHPASVWARGIDALPLKGELREVIDLILPDEFPLNVFYEALGRKLKPVIESAVGITG